MNDQDQNQQPAQVTPPVPEVKKPKFNFDKKTLKMAGIAIAIFLVLALILSFIVKSIRSIKVPSDSPIPTPQESFEPVPVSTESGELNIYRVQLRDLKTQIDNLDVDQSYLKPPAINFKINF